MAKTCSYCDGPLRLVSGEYHYPHRLDLRKKMFWTCIPCEAWVGCHPNTLDPSGRVAKKELRRLKSEAHAAFDPIWQSKAGGRKLKGSHRRKAYRWLANQLGIEYEDCHIGLFDEDQCREVIRVCDNRTKKNKKTNKDLERFAIPY